MVTDFDVYSAFRRAQANAADRGYRLPKNWEQFKGKMNRANLEWLQKLTMYFNTTYSNIDINKYMECGFELWKGFTYKHFCDQKVIDLYITKDKVNKRKLSVSKEEVEKSFYNIDAFLKKRPVREGYGQLQSFCKFRDGELRCVVDEYIKGNVDNITMMYCIYKKYITLTDDERAKMPYISKRYRETIGSVLELIDHLENMEEWLNERFREQAVS